MFESTFKLGLEKSKHEGRRTHKDELTSVSMCVHIHSEDLEELISLDLLVCMCVFMCLGVCLLLNACSCLCIIIITIMIEIV